MADIKVYGANWCGMTTRTLSHLDKLGLEYEYIEVEEDAKASEWVKAQNGGREKKPTLDIKGTIISEPSNAELDKVLAETGVLSRG